ncbi:cyclic AMP-dependent transcription factor ATF-2-like isoform X2 [Nilaparvata lugens]|uniref:cyclic AMP-dependent transcription factor ATF-2-like isoform X2 n=1 Tax=Nilaparvata lugens TaxID=108931 RepID=UPI00193DA349|nr:cyclic AMP-dependent transcription factor ATF-2-like isoform X2 [Nilaparvata lugens]
MVPLDKCNGSHSRRHEMVLNITPKTTSICTDQTPTPTRLIRKCEEVGLFQDLQNVNPFEETFRKAAEAVRTGSTSLQVSNLCVPLSNADDTLHTPNLFPNVPENELPCSRSIEIPLNDKICDTPEHVHLTCDGDNITDLELRSPRDNLINVLETCPTGVETHLPPESALNSQNTVQILLCTPNGKETLNVMPIETLDSTSGRANSIHLPLAGSQEFQNCNQTFAHLPTPCITQEAPSVKNKLKQSLLKNSHCTKNQDEQNNNENQVLSVINKPCPAPKVLIPPLSKTPVLPVKRKIQPESNQVQNYVDANDDKKDKLEKNRASAMRCRAKRKKMMEEMQNRCSNLESVNQKLQSVISNLRSEIAQLQTLLLAHRNCPVTDAMVQEGTVEKSEKVITFSLPSVVPPDEKLQAAVEKTKLTIRMVDGPAGGTVVNSSRIISSSSSVPLLNAGPLDTTKNVLILPKGPSTNYSIVDGSKSVATNVIQINPNITERNNVR